MGMYDTIEHKDPRIHCPAGHMLGTLQTKDLGLVLETYDLLTYPTPSSKSGQTDDWKTTLHRRDTGIRPDHEDPFPRTRMLQGNHVIRAYTTCNQCKTPGEPSALVVGTPLWCDFELVFKDGALVDVLRKTPDMWAAAPRLHPDHHQPRMDDDMDAVGDMEDT